MWQFEETEIVIAESGKAVAEIQVIKLVGSEIFVILFSRCVSNIWDGACA